MTDDEQNSPEAESDDSDSVKAVPGSEPTTRTSAPRQLLVSLRSVVIAMAILGVAGAIATPTWLYIDARSKLAAQSRQAQDNAHAEKIALDYAVGAAGMNFKDLSAWKAKLVAGTTPELKDRLTKAATEMEQILVPLQWDSTAQPFVAKVHSETAGTYVVNAFVGVLTKSVQAPEGLQSTATYSITIDSNKDWQISDVGGVGDVLGKR